MGGKREIEKDAADQKSTTTTTTQEEENFDLAERIIEEMSSDVAWWRPVLAVAILTAASALLGGVATSQIFILSVPTHRCYIPEMVAGTNQQIYNKANFNYLANDNMLNQSIPFEMSTESYSTVACSQCYRYRQVPYTGPPVTINASQSSSSDNNNWRNLVEQCNQWVFDYSLYPETLISELELICEGRAYMTKAPEMCFFAGIMVGSALFGYISDAFGRRTTLIASTFIHILSGAVVSAYWRTNDGLYYTYCVMNFVHGAVGTGVYQTGFVLAAEILSKKHRIVATWAFATGWSVGEAAGAALAMAKLPWRLYNALIFIPLVVCIVAMFFIPESLRWLDTTGQTEKLLRTIQRWSGHNPKYTKAWLQQLQQQVVSKSLSTNRSTITAGAVEAAAPGAALETKNQRSTFADIFSLLRHGRVMLAVLVMCYTWFVCSLVYYGISLDMAILGGNPYLNSILVSLCEIPGNLLVFLLIDKVGRRPVYAGSFFVVAAALAALGFVPFQPNFQWLIILLALVGKCAVSAAYYEAYIYAAEIVPTVVRTVALGVCGMTSHAGGLVAPAIALLANKNRSIPFWIFAGTAVVSALSCFVLPETKGKRLPATFEDIEDHKKKNKICVKNNIDQLQLTPSSSGDSGEKGEAA